MIEAFCILLGIGVLFFFMLRDRRWKPLRLDDMEKRLNSKSRKDGLYQTGGICFIDADGNIGTVRARRPRSDHEDTKIVIPEFLRR